MARALDEFELTGRARTHVLQHADPRFAAQREVVAAFREMREAARIDGIDLRPVASYRDFGKQLEIWNTKFHGKAMLRDIEGKPFDRATMSPADVVWAILGWSSLPGGSRRHWGTDIDVVDAAAMPAGYKAKLLPEEVAPGGLFVALHRWLDEHIERFGFFRPYRTHREGMYPEPWHLSYRALSAPALAQVGIDLLAEVIADSPILGRELVLELLPEIHRRHIRGVDP